MTSQQACAKVVSQFQKVGRRDVAAHSWKPETLAYYEDLGVHPISEVGVGISVPFVPFLIRSHDVAEEHVPPWGKVKLTGSGLANLKLFNLSDELGAVHTLLGQEAGLFMVVVRNLQQLGNRPIRPENHYLVRVIRPAIGRRDFLDAGLNPNPPKDSGRGVGELQGRYPGLHWGRWEVRRAVCRRFWGRRWRPAVAVMREMAR